MAALPEPVRLTYEDYLTFPEDGRRHELFEGDYAVSPAPNLKHQRILGNLHWWIQSQLRETPLGTLWMAPCDVVLSPFTVVQPDLLFVSEARSAILTDTHIQGAPDLIVEILSSSTRKTDLVVKRKLYGRFAVQEYWVVDPVVETITVFHQQDGQLVKQRELSRENRDQLTTPLLPGLSVRLDSVFA